MRYDCGRKRSKMVQKGISTLLLGLNQLKGTIHRPSGKWTTVLTEMGINVPWKSPNPG